MPTSPPEAAQAVATWPQIGAAIGAFVTTIVVGILAYLKKGRQVSAGSEVAVVSATFADKATMEAHTKALKRLADATDKVLETFADEAREARRTTEDHTTAMRDLSAALRTGGQNPTAEMLRLIDTLIVAKRLEN